MYRKTTALMALFFLVQGEALAHDASKHKGKPVHGTVTAVTETAVSLKTEGDKPMTVELQAKTQIVEAGDAHTKTKLAPGQHVEVFGTKLPGGKLVAREVIVHKTK